MDQTKRKKRYRLLVPICAAAIVLVLALVGLLLPRYPLSCSFGEISEVTIYNCSSLEKKVLPSEDIPRVVRVLKWAVVMGEYKSGDIPDGGIPFVIAIKLKTGTSFNLTYCQTSSSSGFLADSSDKNRVLFFDLLGFWNTIQSQPIPAYADKEVNDIPSIQP